MGDTSKREELVIYPEVSVCVEDYWVFGGKCGETGKTILTVETNLRIKIGRYWYLWNFKKRDTAPMRWGINITNNKTPCEREKELIEALHRDVYVRYYLNKPNIKPNDLFVKMVMKKDKLQCSELDRVKWTYQIKT